MDNGREYREYDLPTDTDDSSVGQSSPLDGKSFYSGSGKKKLAFVTVVFMYVSDTDNKALNEYALSTVEFVNIY